MQHFISYPWRRWRWRFEKLSCGCISHVVCHAPDSMVVPNGFCLVYKRNCSMIAKNWSSLYCNSSHSVQSPCSQFSALALFSALCPLKSLCSLFSPMFSPPAFCSVPLLSFQCPCSPFSPHALPMLSVQSPCFVQFSCSIYCSHVLCSFPLHSGPWVLP